MRRFEADCKQSLIRTIECHVPLINQGGTARDWVNLYTGFGVRDRE